MVQRDESCWGAPHAGHLLGVLVPSTNSNVRRSAYLAIERAAPYSGEFQNSWTAFRGSTSQ